MDTNVTEELIPIARIHPNPHNPRTEAGDVTDLIRSIRAVGLLQSALVRPAYELCIPGENHYYLEAGHRRWTAMRLAGYAEMPCRVRIPAENEDQLTRMLTVGVIENLHRQKLNPMELARAYGKLRDEREMTQLQIADAMGISDTSVSRSLALLVLTPKTQKAVESGLLNVEDALRLIKQFRREGRKKKGQRQSGAQWDPDHFTREHHLATKANVMCDAKDHSSRRRIGRVACGQCWETVIRQDEAKSQQVAYADQSGMPITEVPFRPAWPVDHPMSNRD